MENKPLVACERLTKEFPLRGTRLLGRKRTVRAVDQVDLSIGRGRTLGLVGESGSGKSTLGRLLLRLIEPTSGTMRFEGVDLLALSTREMQATRRRMQIVFQDPYGSLNPYKTVAQTIEEPLRIFRIGDAASRRKRVDELLLRVGLLPEHARRYPHEFSGGQRQRISIARALALEPAFVVCDEPVSALDVSVQAQIVNLLQDLQESLGLTYLFISHDLGVVRHVASEVAVMYLGRIVETGKTEQIFSAPAHPYTGALLAAMPSIAVAADDQLYGLIGEAGGSADGGKGCRFRARCPIARALCHEVEPQLAPVGPHHMAACHFATGTTTHSSEPNGTTHGRQDKSGG